MYKHLDCRKLRRADFKAQKSHLSLGQAAVVYLVSLIHVMGLKIDDKVQVFMQSTRSCLHPNSKLLNLG